MRKTIIGLTVLSVIAFLGPSGKGAAITSLSNLESPPHIFRLSEPQSNILEVRFHGGVGPFRIQVRHSIASPWVDVPEAVVTAEQGAFRAEFPKRSDGIALYRIVDDNKLGASPVSKLSETVQPSRPAALGWETPHSQRLDLQLIGEYDSGGEAAWDVKKHPLVYITSNGPGYGGFLSGTESPGLVIIDADTYEVVLEKQFKITGMDPKFYWEDHGLGVSPDGKWIYIPTGDTSKPVNVAGLLLVVNARTLKIHQVIQTSSFPHHIKTVDYYDGQVRKNLVLVENFNWQVPGRIEPGSGVYALDHLDRNRVVGGLRSEDVQGNPYLAFPHPDGRHLYIGLPPGPISDPDVTHQLEGLVSVVDMKTWKPVKYFVAGFDPIWTAFTADGKYAYVGDGGSDEIFKIDNVALKKSGTSRSSVHGGYGIVLNWEETKLYVVEKGEASHNRGHSVGLVDPISLRPLDSFESHCLRGDHALLHPDPARHEIWISYNSNFRDVVFDTKTDTIKKTILHSGSSHNGAFVRYAVDDQGAWTGEVLSDQSGLHGRARALKEDLLGVKEIAWGGQKVSVNVFRSTPTNAGTTPDAAGPQLRQFTVRITATGFNEKTDYAMVVTKGDTVRIDFVNKDPFDDSHPIGFAGLDVPGVVLSGDQKNALAEFVAVKSGTFGFACFNPWCAIHDTLLNGKIIVQEPKP